MRPRVVLECALEFLWCTVRLPVRGEAWGGPGMLCVVPVVIVCAVEFLTCPVRLRVQK